MSTGYANKTEVILTMKIQLVVSKKPTSKLPSITVSPIDAPKSLDEFDVNIIDLSGADLWYNDQSNYSTINKSTDFSSIQTMIEKKKTSKVIIACPQNLPLCYDKYTPRTGAPHYTKSKPLKDIIDTVCRHILSKITPTNSLPLHLLYENTRTTLNHKTYEAAFYFDSNDKVLTKSDFSQKPTTVVLADSDVYATTLKVSSSLDDLNVFLNSLFPERNTETAPEWFSAVTFGDDDQQKSLISQKEKEIEEATISINAANEKLAKNARYKSILYTNGNELVEVVFEMLEKMLGCDLSDFEDKRKEDFLIETDKYTLIGEIKGVTSNVRRDNISQIDNHYNGYLDDHPGIDATKVHQVLIINPLRKQKPDEREPIHEDQINLAKRNGCLIVETSTLLRLFEKWQNGTVSKDQCIDAFCNTTGLLNPNVVINPTDDLDSY